MNLKVFLILRIILVAGICLVVTAGYILYQSDRQSRLEIDSYANAIQRQLELQRLRIDVGAESPRRFPDLKIWAEKGLAPGRCIRYRPIKNESSANLCQGESVAEGNPPDWFYSIYRWLFDPGEILQRPIRYREHRFGTLAVSNSEEIDIGRAWQFVSRLMVFAFVMVTAVCGLVYFSIQKALLPAKEIIGVLRQMQQGELSVRVPDFAVREWQETGQALNLLAERLEISIQRRRQLMGLLMNVQENERRHLARELHDEFGQCLTGLNAVGESICRSTRNQSLTGLALEGKTVKQIAGHMLELLRDMLSRLRLSDLDQFGLEVALRNLVGTWNTRKSERVCFELVIHTDLSGLPERVSVNLYRIVQECLTNISRHSTGNLGTVCLERILSSVGSGDEWDLQLTVSDNGRWDSGASEKTDGFGLSGIQERVLLLGGALDLGQARSEGFLVRVRIPLTVSRNSSE